MATLERTRASLDPQQQEQRQDSSSPPAFVPSAVPSVFLPPLSSVRPIQQEEEDDLIDLGQERLFSGTRTAAARAAQPSAEGEEGPAEGEAVDGQARERTRTGSQDLLPSLGAARQAFLFALSGLLGQYFSSSASAVPGSTIPGDALNSTASSSISQPDQLLTSLLDTLRAASPAPPSHLLPHLRPASSASPASQMLSIERSSPLLASSPSVQLTPSAQPLLEELQARVEAAAAEGVLPPTEAELARSLAGLLTCIERLATMSRTDSSSSSFASPTLTTTAPSLPASAPPAAANVYETLEQQAALLQARRDLRASEAEMVVGAAREVEQAERELLWGRVDDLSERVGRLARRRAEGLLDQQQQQRGEVESAVGDAKRAEAEAEAEEKEGRTIRSRSSSLYEPSLSDLPRYSRDFDRPQQGQGGAHLPPGYYSDFPLGGGDEKERLARDDEKDDWDVKPPKSPSLRSPATLAAAAFASSSTSAAAVRARKVSSLPAVDPEKMQRDLDNVTSAIERLYVVSPQLANQRVEPDRRKQRERQLAKLGNAIERLSQGRLEDQRAVPSPVIGEPEGEEESRGERRRREQVALDRLLDQIDRAASRTLADQRVELNGKRKEVLNSDTANPEFAPADKYEARRREYILSHTGKGRLAGQDAVLPSHSSASGLVEPFPPPPAELNQPVTITEFFAADEAGGATDGGGGEAMRARSQSVPPLGATGGALPAAAAAAAPTGVKKKFSSRTLFQARPVTPGEEDSTSAAPGKKGSLRIGVFKKGGASAAGGVGGGMLRRSSYDATGMTGLGVFGTGMSRSASAASEVEVLSVPQFDWITEESRNLGTLVVTFWPRSSSAFSRDDEFEVLAVEGESIVVAPSRGGPASRLSLPCRVVPQQANVSSSASSAIHEVKLITSNPSPTKSRADLEVHTPLSTDELRRSMPTSFACSVCSTQLADARSIRRYNALPSEHWAELLDAWMCHQDQELSADLIAKGKGIKPRRDEGLVGTSYVLLPAEVTQSWSTPQGSEPTRSPSDDLLYPAHCTTCSSLIGAHVTPLNPASSSARESTSFRLLKYATYPAREPTAEEADQGAVSIPPPRYSLASFLTAEMLETGQAHACHRFVLEEAETESAKLLLWFFNPAVRLSFSTSAALAGILDTPGSTSSPSSLTPSPATSSGSPASSSSAASAHKLTSRSMNAVKIFYAVVSNDTDPRCADFLSQKAERVPYPRAVVARVADLLRASTLVYPPAKRRFGEFDVGFLERI
ncbi:hypothetical protein JCM6882_002260 [Rhodosporidiobolus microsporus]